MPFSTYEPYEIVKKFPKILKNQFKNFKFDENSAILFKRDYDLNPSTETINQVLSSATTEEFIEDNVPTKDYIDYFY